MKRLEDLIEHDEPALPLLKELLSTAQRSCQLLPPSEDNARVLLGLQVTTRSTLGAVAYETGGILIDGGWLRFLGSGHEQLSRNILDWTHLHDGGGHLLVADDAAGGFFSINGGRFGEDVGSMYYWAPDTLEWEPLEIGYTDFLEWALSDQMLMFYKDLKWPTWQEDLEKMSADQCMTFYPFLWTQEGSLETSSRRIVDVAEHYELNIDLARQLEHPPS
ncbi:DUF2625 domain-containing protein [Pseudomonas syringae]|nr:DUF2625 domain-containing protein [Pseudomonas syringae]